MSKTHAINILVVFVLGLIVGCSTADPPRARSETTEGPLAETGNVVKVGLALNTGDDKLGAYSLLLPFDNNRAKFRKVLAWKKEFFRPPQYNLLTKKENETSVIRIASFEIDRQPSGYVPIAVVVFSSSSDPSLFLGELKLEAASDPEGNPIDAQVFWDVLE